jgi:dipeptidyl-peptidase-3
MDERVLELGLLPEADAAKTTYDVYIRNGLLTQLVRIKPGKDIEEAHMRCRSAISHWTYQMGKDERVIELFRRDNKTFVRINDYRKLRKLFGSMLMEIQRIKSEEDFGIKVDRALNEEILARYSKLNLAPYTGFVNPNLVPVYDSTGDIIDVAVVYTNDFLGQMMYYGKNYSFLP